MTNIKVSEQDIRECIRSYIVDQTKTNMNELDGNTTFDNYGIDSLLAVHLTGELSELLNEEIDPTLLYDYNTIEKLTRHLSEILEQ